MKLFFKAQFYTLLFLLLLLFLTLVGASIFGLLKYNSFKKQTNLSMADSFKMVKSGWNHEVVTTDGYKNILVLGLDSLETRGDSPPLTDTMMLVSLNTNTAEIRTLSFPRDLWHESYQTRINALYYYGQDRYPETPQQFPAEVVSEMIGMDIHHTLVLSFDEVSQLIDLLEGVEIDVPVAFVDEEFPRSDVDVTVVHDPRKLYKTIEFEVGKQVMDGETALEYMRSRKSRDDEGTDVARGSRQQLVIEALISKLKQRDTLTNASLIGKLYNFYDESFSQVISIKEIVALSKKLYPVRSGLSFRSNSLSIFPDNDYGVIWHPPEWQYQGEWVYALRDEAKFAQYVRKTLVEDK